MNEDYRDKVEKFQSYLIGLEFEPDLHATIKTFPNSFLVELEIKGEMDVRNMGRLCRRLNQIAKYETKKGERK